jgi:hypothetical protein
VTIVALSVGDRALQGAMSVVGSKTEFWRRFGIGANPTGESLSHSEEKGLRGSGGHADHQSIFSFALRTASLHFSISSLIQALNSSGVAPVHR